MISFRRLFLFVLLGLVLLGVSGAAQTFDPIKQRRPDTAIIILTIDGKPQPVAAVAYMVSGTLFVHGVWVEDSTAKFGPSSTASAFSLRVDGSTGEHPITPGNTSGNGTFFSVLYSGVSGLKVYRIFRADESNGQGSATILSRDEVNVKGSFSFTAVNIMNSSDTKKITGSFDINFRQLTMQ
jgi:hypothetical protein